MDRKSGRLGLLALVAGEAMLMAQAHEYTSREAQELIQRYRLSEADQGVVGELMMLQAREERVMSEGRSSMATFRGLAI